MKMQATLSRGAGIGVLLLAISPVLISAGGYHVIKRIPIPGDTGWDYITADTAGRRAEH